jgi:hypothetical protein
MHTAFSNRGCKVIVLSSTHDAARRLTESIGQTPERQCVDCGAGDLHSLPRHRPQVSRLNRAHECRLTGTVTLVNENRPTWPEHLWEGAWLLIGLAVVYVAVRVSESDGFLAGVVAVAVLMTVLVLVRATLRRLTGWPPHRPDSE